MRAPSLGRRDRAVGGDLRRRIEELVAADEQRALPFRARVVREALLRARRERHRAGGGVADHDGVLEDLAHPLVGRERLAVDDPDRGEQAEQLGVAGSGRFLLHQLVDQLPEPEVVREERVDRHAGRLDELRLGRGDRAAPTELSGEERRDRRAVRARHVRGTRKPSRIACDRDLRIVVDHERPADEGHSCRAGVEDVVAAVGQRPVVAGPDDR